MFTVSTSKLKCFRSCPRKYMWKYEECVVRKEQSHALSFGTAIHGALEAWWCNGDLESAYEVIDTTLLDPEDNVRGKALLAGYHARWIDEPLTTVAVEHEFEVMIGDPKNESVGLFKMVGRIDALARDERGKLWVVEHKTSSADISYGSQYWKQLRIDSQVSNYVTAMMSNGHEIAGCLYDVIKKPTIKRQLATPYHQRKYTKSGVIYANQREQDEPIDEYSTRIVQDIYHNPDAYYVRGEVVRLEQELKDAHEDIWNTCWDINYCSRYGRWARNPDACFSYGRPCEYWELCTHQANLNSPLFERKI